MAKIYQFYQNVPAMIKPRPMHTPGEIKCSDCHQLVPMMELGSHVCITTGTVQDEKQLDSLSYRRNAKAAGLKISTSVAKSSNHNNQSQPASAALSSPAIRPVTPLSATCSSRSQSPFTPSHSSLNPSTPASSTSNPRNKSILNGGSEYHSFQENADASPSPRLSPTSHNKLPFFEKYAKVYGGSNAASPTTATKPPSPSFPASSLPRANTGDTTQMSTSTSASSLYTSASSTTESSCTSFETNSTEVSSKLSLLLGPSRSSAASQPHTQTTTPSASYTGQKRSVSNGSASDRSVRGMVASASHSQNLSGLLVKSNSSSSSRSLNQIKASHSEPTSLAALASGSRNPSRTPSSKSSTSQGQSSTQRKRHSPSDNSVAQLDNLLSDLTFEGSSSKERRSKHFESEDEGDPFDYSSYMSGSASSPIKALPFSSTKSANPPICSTSSLRDRYKPAVLATQKQSCSQCRCTLNAQRLTEAVQADVGIICATCYADLYLPKCRKCRKAIQGRATGSGDGKVKGKFHPECFTCFACDEPFPNKEFYVWDERPFCARHYHQMAGSECQNCRTGIEGPCVTLTNQEDTCKRYHTSCFTCSHIACSAILSEYHYVVEGLPYCEPHALSLAAEPHEEEAPALPFAPKANGLPSGPSSRRPRQANRRIEKRRTIIAPVRRR